MGDRGHDDNSGQRDHRDQRRDRDPDHDHFPGRRRSCVRERDPHVDAPTWCAWFMGMTSTPRAKTRTLDWEHETNPRLFVHNRDCVPAIDHGDSPLEHRDPESHGGGHGQVSAMSCAWFIRRPFAAAAKTACPRSTRASLTMPTTTATGATPTARCTTLLLIHTSTARTGDRRAAPGSSHPPPQLTPGSESRPRSRATRRQRRGLGRSP